MAYNLIYVEFDDNFLLLSKLDKQKDQFILNEKRIINLNNSEIKDGILYNLSAVCLHIKNFLETNKIKEAKAIICIPKLSTKKEILQKLNTFKVALCACKANLKIHKIIDHSLLIKGENMAPKNFFYKKELENRLDFFKTFNPPKSKNPYKWFLFSGIALFCLITSLYIIQADNNCQLDLLHPQNTKLLNKNKRLENEVKVLHSVKNENYKIKDKIEKIKKIKTSLNNPINILVATTKNIPENSWLTNIAFGNFDNLENTNKKLKESKKLEIEGITTHEEEITSFLNKLSKSPEITNLKLSKIQKMKKSQINQLKPHYNFKFSGEIHKT